MGSCLVLGIPGAEADAALGAFLQDLRPGGVILFARNLQDEVQIRRLTAALRGPDRARPRLVGVDQEGGRVERLRPLLGRLPAAATLAALGPEAVRDYAELLGAALRGLGFHLDFAPVLDLSRPGAPNGIGDRAFADDPDTVTRLGDAWLRGLAASGLLGVPKHFPGLGPTAVDSHRELPRAEIDPEAFRRHHLAPFRACLPRAPAVMVGHAHYPFLDPEPIPASLSRRVVQGLLRDELGYAGVVVTDDLEMGALGASDDWAGRAAAALGAGCDLLMVCARPERMRALRDALVREVAVGALPEARLREAAGRVESLRRQAGAAAAPRWSYAEARHRLRRRVRGLTGGA